MIVGIGTDLVEISRIQEILVKPEGTRFLERILTPRERELAAGHTARITEFAAGRFAAKEAVVKALGCGIGGTVGFLDVEVLPESGKSGRPLVRLSEVAAARLAIGIDTVIHISITHTNGLAAAYAVVERL